MTDYKFIIYIPVFVVMVSVAMGLTPEKKTNILYEDMDQNGDGVITRDEWRGNNDLIFNNNDWNGDGVLTGDERKLEMKGHVNIKSHTLRYVESFHALDQNRKVYFDHFRDLDRDNDGVISRLEWH